MQKHTKNIVWLFFLLIQTGSSLYAQFNSPALDPDCYFPKIGNGMDSIYGANKNQRLGDLIKNIGTFPGVDGSVFLISGLPPNPPFLTATEVGSGFNLHNLKRVSTKQSYVPPRSEVSYLLFAHLHTSAYKDMIVCRESFFSIYWADDEGNYDSNRFSYVRVPKKDGLNYSLDEPLLRPYITYLTSDTVEDMVFGAFWGNNESNYNGYMALYKGGESLYAQGDTLFCDSLEHYSKISNSTLALSDRFPIVGDFRGSGRSDLIAYSPRRDIFYYKNEKPFTMKGLVHSLLYDTLFAKWQNPQLDSTRGGFFDIVPIPFFPRASGDKSQDVMFRLPLKPVDGKWQNSDISHVFRGGNELGQKRLILDSADYVFHNPRYWDQDGFTGFPINAGDFICGDMTGTGNPVYMLGIGNGYASINFFYVLGEAADDKADMAVVNVPGMGGDIEMITANKDGLQDIIIGDGWYSLSGKMGENYGTIHVVYGSKKIPVKTTAVLAGHEREHLKATQMYAYPNPLNQKTTLTFENCTSGVMYMDVVNGLGVSVLREEIPDVDGLQQYAADLSGLPAAAYHIRLVCPADGWSASASVIKTGAAVQPWSLNLKKMMGR